MMENKNRTLVLTILLVIFAFSLLSMVIRIKARSSKFKGSAKKVVAELGSKEIVFREDLDKKFQNMKFFRDPFVLGGPGEEREEVIPEESPFQLTAIVWDQIRPLAIINNEVMGIGDVIKGAQIVAIEKNEVKLRKGSEVIELKLRFEE